MYMWIIVNGIKNDLYQEQQRWLYICYIRNYMLYFHNKINGIKIDMKLNPQLWLSGLFTFQKLLVFYKNKRR